MISIVSENVIDEVKIFSIQGILIENTSEINEIDVSHLSSGIYFVEVHSGKERNVQKFIKK